MAKAQLATRVDAALRDAVREVCAARGIKMTRFIEDALIDKLEDLEDLEDISALKREQARPLSEILAELETG